MNAHQPLEQWLEQIQPQRVLRVALGPRRLLVHFEEHAVNARRHAGRRQRLDELGLPGRDAVTAARQLQAVRDVVDHRISERAHDGEGAHVDDEVVIAEREPALGHDHLLVAGAR